MKFHVWLEEKFIEWMARDRKRKTVTAFAEWIGVSQSQMTRYLNGQILPTGENVHKIAACLGPEVYDLLGLVRPDEDLQIITSHWHLLPAWLKKRILNDVERAQTGELTDDATVRPQP